MKKLLNICAIVAVCLLALSSCGDDDVPTERTYANTVFIYMPWTGSETSSNGSLTSYFHENINDIKSAIRNGNGNTNTRTIVFFADSVSGSRLFEINDDGTESLLLTMNKGTVTNAGDLTQLLNTVASLSPTTTYSMLIGSHGSGWLPVGNQPFSRSFGGQTAGTQADITTLATAITQSNIGKMQYVCFDDCYMANIETAYALRNATDWLIGSTSEVMAAGLPYSNIWQYLSMPSPSYASIVSGFGDFYSSYTYPYGELSAIYCRGAAEVATLMHDFNQKYDGVNYDKDNVQPLDGYHNHVFYDMGSYIDEVCSSDTTGNQQLYSAIESIVAYHTCTPQLYTAYYGGGAFNVATCSGITISDPSTNPDAVTSKTQTEWWKATH